MKEASIKRAGRFITLSQTQLNTIVNHPDVPIKVKDNGQTFLLTRQEMSDMRYIGIHNHIVGRLLGSFCLMPDIAEEAAGEIMTQYDTSRFPAGLEELLYEKSEEKAAEMDDYLPF